MAPAVLLSTPAFATSGTGSADAAVSSQDSASQAERDRAEIERIHADKKSGRILREAAEKALKGTPAEMRAFLETGRNRAQTADDRLRVIQILSIGGKAVRKAATDALRDGSHEALVHFLEKAQYTARDEDNRFEILRIIGDKKTGPGLQKGAQKAMNGTAADRQKFLDTDRHALKIVDNRVLVGQIITAGGPEVRKAGVAALEGSPEDVQKFIDEGQFTARAKDARNAKHDKGSKDDKSEDSGKGDKGDKGGEQGKGQDNKPTAEDQKQDQKQDGEGARPAVGSTDRAMTDQSKSTEGALADTGTNGALPWAAGGTAIALSAGAGLVVLTRRRVGTER